MSPRTRPAGLPAPLQNRLSLVTLGDDVGRAWEGADVLAVGVSAASGTPGTAVPTGATTGPARTAAGPPVDAAVDPPAGGRPVPDATAGLAAERYGVDLAAVLVAERVSGRAGEVVRVPVQAPSGLPGRLLLVGTGTHAVHDLRRAGAALARVVRGRERVVTSLADGQGPDAVRALVEGLHLGGYAPPATGTKRRADAVPARRVELAGRLPAEALAAGTAHALATARARDLAATPSNVKTPAWLADRAAEYAADAGLEITVWDESALAADGFGGLLAVGAGSVNPPRLVRLDYQPEAPTQRRGRVVLAGKGITYDTGG
ncbi:MAG TPA: M17 family peptidase N-terminal domain-containing protein, partial [Kineosporiaceae bacterium]